MIRLFTTRFPETNLARRAEYALALSGNLACAVIDEVCLLDECPDTPLPASAKIRQRSISRRPLYNDYFVWIDEVAGPDDLSVITNADIVLDSGFGLFRQWQFPENSVYALARWDTSSEGRPTLRDRNDSQDTWVFRGRTRDIGGDFPIGVPRCDNRIAKELEIAGYRVLNPSFSLKTYHLHAGDRSAYPQGDQPGFVPPPYLYVWPHNLWSLPRTLAHNSMHPRARVGWRVDRRLLKRRIKTHWFKKSWAALTGSQTNRG